MADAVHRNDTAVLHKKPQDAGIELAHMAQLEQPAAERFGQWFAVILFVPQFCQSCDNRSKIIRITDLQLVKKFTNRARPRSRLGLQTDAR